MNKKTFPKGFDIKNPLFKRLFRVMKVITLFLLLFVFCLSAENLHSQNTRFSIEKNNTRLEQIINEIERQSDYLFVYTKDINIKQEYSVNVRQSDIEETLARLFAGSDVNYEIERTYIVLSRSKGTSGKSMNQQNSKRISGTVTDEHGVPIIGANIVIKGTKSGVISDIDGHFTMNTEPGAILVVSYIGYEIQEIAVGNQSNLSIQLMENTNDLEELVVVGYGTQKKINLAGAVEAVSSKTLESRSTNNVALALQGLVPNLTIKPGGGQADNVPDFNIRGETSINGGAPLILVDGIPTDAGDFARMNSMDIENISVLKDASSAAIYGARAAFGVILVTTKKGQGEKLTVHFNNNFNVRTPTRMPKVVLDPYIQTAYKKEMGKPWYDLYTDAEVEYARQRRDDQSLPGTITNSLDPSRYTYLHATDWYAEVFDNLATSNSHNLSISGSTSKVSYYLGAELYQERGLLKINKDEYDKYNVRSRVEYKPTGWLTFGNNTALTYYTYDRPVNFDDWLFGRVISTNSLVPVYNPDGSYTKEGSEIVGTLREGGTYKDKNSTIYTQFTADFELIKNVWNVKADFTAKFTNSKLNEWDSDRTIPYREGIDSPLRYHGWTNFAQSTSKNTNYTMFNLYTDIRKTFGIHSLSALGGYSQEYETYEKFFGKRLDLITDSYPTSELAIGEMTINESMHAWVVRSAFYRLNYILDGKYILETNGRYDGTSRFRKEDRFGFFPSVSAAWILSGEHFFEPLHTWFSHLKLRGSYGSLGNQGVNPSNADYYPYIATMAAEKVNYLVNGEKPMGVKPPGLVSNTLTWEKVYTLNGGIDANFLKNRLAISYDIYRRDTKDMLTKGRTLPNVLGTAEPNINAADMKTTGWELSVLWRDNYSLAGKPFNYSARFILSDSRSFITKFDNPTSYLGNDKNRIDHYVGEELGEIWGLETLGFFKDQADIDTHADQWDVTSYPGDRPIEAGDLKYKDQNEDGKINSGQWTVDDPGDYKIIGNASTRYNYGLDMNASWNGFDLRLLFQGVGKKDVYLSGYKFFGLYSSPWGNVMTNTQDHWTPENPNGYFPRLKSYLGYVSNRDLAISQTRYLQNAAYLRMKNITFGYSLPRHLISKAGIENIRIYFSGENLFEITKINKNYDPEGLNSNTHPYYRTFSIGLNITL